MLLFASAREAAGVEALTIPWPEEAGVAELRAAVAAAAPGLQGLLERCMIAVNQEYAASADARVRPGDEVAIIPPVSGGAPGADRPDGALPSRVVESTILLEDLVSAVSSPGAGAIATFIGVVRDHNEGRMVSYLEYEGYAPMAEREMDTIAVEVVEAHPGTRVAMTHRVGRMEIGEASVAIAASSAHRAAAFDACRMAIEELKLRVPIWKKEHFEGGAVWIETPADRA